MITLPAFFERPKGSDSFESSLDYIETESEKLADTYAEDFPDLDRPIVKAVFQATLVGLFQQVQEELIEAEKADKGFEAQTAG